MDLNGTDGWGIGDDGKYSRNVHKFRGNFILCCITLQQHHYCNSLKTDFFLLHPNRPQMSYLADYITKYKIWLDGAYHRRHVEVWFESQVHSFKDEFRPLLCSTCAKLVRFFCNEETKVWGGGGGGGKKKKKDGENTQGKKKKFKKNGTRFENMKGLKKKSQKMPVFFFPPL